MGKYDGIYLYADMDGTLLKDDKTIPEANLIALERFTAEGGRFGVATGRSPHNFSFFGEVLPLNAPSILDNGGALYDVKNERFIECAYIPRERSLNIVHKILHISPMASVQVYTCDARYQVNPNKGHYDDPLIVVENIHEPFIRAEDIQGKWIKIVVCEPEERLMDTLNKLEPETLEDEYSIVLSGKLYFELLHRGTSKGAGIAAVRRNEGGIKKILAIGDYYNDTEMLEQADVSGAPVNAEQAIRDIADHITCDNNQGCVADFLRLALGMEIQQKGE